MNIVILGAGQTGRGFLARLLAHQAHITFIDKDASLIEKLRAAGSYTVGFFDGSESIRISGYQALHTDDAVCRDAIAAADVILVSVRGENGPAAGEWLSVMGAAGKPVIACENATVPAKLLGGAWAAQAASAAIFCTTVENGPLDILSESYPALHVCEKGRVLESLQGFIIEPDFDALMHRKIYTYNAASGIIAYIGWAMGYESYGEAANDPKINALLDGFYAEINAAICAEYPVTPEAQATFAAFSKKKFQNRAIADTVARNAASPLRKLGPEERLMAPIRLIRAHGGQADALIHAAACAARMAGIATEAELAKTTGLSENDPLLTQILQIEC